MALRPEDLEKVRIELESKKRTHDQAEVKVAIVGISGSGKSLFLNALSGKRIAKTGIVETTGVEEEPQEYTCGNITYRDFPGCGTQRFPQDGYLERFNLQDYDLIILITANRFYAA